MLSVNTNTGAMVALQYLNNTNKELQTAQGRINSGLKVATAKDDGAIYAIAQNMRGNVRGYQAIADSLNRGVSTIDVALAAGGAISDLLLEMKAKVLAAADTSLDAASRAAYNQDFTALHDFAGVFAHPERQRNDLGAQFLGQLIGAVHALDGERTPHPAIPIDGVNERRPLSACALGVHQRAGDLAEQPVFRAARIFSRALRFLIRCHCHKSAAPVRNRTKFCT